MTKLLQAVHFSIESMQNLIVTRFFTATSNIFCKWYCYNWTLLYTVVAYPKNIYTVFTRIICTLLQLTCLQSFLQERKLPIFSYQCIFAYLTQSGSVQKQRLQNVSHVEAKGKSDVKLKREDVLITFDISMWYSEVILYSFRSFFGERVQACMLTSLLSLLFSLASRSCALPAPDYFWLEQCHGCLLAYHN